MNEVYLNGSFLAKENAVISVFDRGFLFGDGVYEVVPVYNSYPLGLEDHIERLFHSLKEIKINIDEDSLELKKIILEIIARNKATTQSIYIQITRGTETVRQHLPSPDIKATIFICSLTNRKIGAIKEGLSAITQNDFRWQRCDIKAITLLANVLLMKKEVEHNAKESILIRDGYVTECSAANIFIVKNGQIYTPPANNHILDGVTRRFVFHLAKKHHQSITEKLITEQELFTADEIWLSSSTKEISPIVTVNDIKVGDGKPGKIWEKFHGYYQEHLAILNNKYECSEL